MFRRTLCILKHFKHKAYGKSEKKLLSNLIWEITFNKLIQTLKFKSRTIFTIKSENGKFLSF